MTLGTAVERRIGGPEVARVAAPMEDLVAAPMEDLKAAWKGAPRVVPSRHSLQSRSVFFTSDGNSAAVPSAQVRSPIAGFRRPARQRASTRPVSLRTSTRAKDITAPSDRGRRPTPTNRWRT
jgi:hypothetical protein